MKCEESPLPVGAQVFFEAGLRPAKLCIDQAENRTVRQCQRAVDLARQHATASVAGYLRALLLGGADLDTHARVVRRPPDQAERLREAAAQAQAAQDRIRQERSQAASDDDRRAALAAAREIFRPRQN